jgi:RimJ/RimL family protein N-acetyltransferase
LNRDIEKLPQSEAVFCWFFQRKRSVMSDRVIFLKGKKVIMRPMNQETDMADFQRWINDPEIRRFLTGCMPISMQQEEKWFDALPDRHGHIALAIETIEDGVLIGNMALHNINWISGTAVTGALIGNIEYQGRGYGTDAKMTLLNYAFNTLGLRKVCSEVLDFNGRSLRYAAKCGYKEEGRLVQHNLFNGKYYDNVLLAVFREDWLPLWEKYQLQD